MNRLKTNEIIAKLRQRVDPDQQGNTLVDVNQFAVGPEDLPYLQCLALFEIAVALDGILQSLPEAGRGV